MSHQLWGPFHLMPNCRLWVAEDRTCQDCTESELALRLADARLSDRERDRWDRYRPLEKKKQFLNSRLVIRAVLNCEFGTDSAHLIVDTMESGRPLLMDSQKRQVANISLSHTGNMTTIALSNVRYGLGIDIETIQQFNARSFGLSFINQFERDGLMQAALTEDPNATLAIWTLKEAFWKALGGPHDAALGDIVAEYRNHILTAHVSCLSGKQKPLATQFFGHGYSFPSELRNYSSINVPESEISAFVGCVVLVDTQLIENQQVSNGTGSDRQR
jgi:phosphopantetheinyl transferase